MWGLGNSFVIKVLEMDTEDMVIIIIITTIMAVIMEVTVFSFQVLSMSMLEVWDSIDGVLQVEPTKLLEGTITWITIMDGILTIMTNS